MYFPYFRGKQYELITIRENAPRLAQAAFVPIIEPVKESLGGLEKALTAVCDAEGKAVVIVNPHHGSLRADGDAISTLLREKFLPRDEVAAGILLKAEMPLNEAVECYAQHRDHELTFVHAGFLHGKALAQELGAELPSTRHVFVGDVSKLYQRHFQGCERVLVKDGFIRRKRNADHPMLEEFSDLHLVYREEGMTGFGDFLTVGDDYMESGGPAYSVAIHLTFIDGARDDVMFIYHFKSKRSDTPGDPAGKFAEALNAMMETLGAPGSKVYESEAVKEFRSLHERGHFPGLGYIKKLSLQHHIETLAEFFSA